MNKAERLEVSQAFEKTRVYLAKSMTHYKTAAPELFICHALDKARERGKITHGAYHRAKHVVQSRLLPHFTLDTWIINHVSDVDFSSVDFDDWMQQHRHAWLNRLIKEFSK